MQFTTKPFIDAQTIQQRLETLADQVVDSFPSVQAGVTLVSVTDSSRLLTEHFAAVVRRQSVDVVVLDAEDVPRAQWIVNNANQWLESCILIQDVSSTAEQIQRLFSFCRDNLDIPVRTLIVLSKRNEDVDVPSWEPDWIGFHIPNEYVVGWGMGIHKQLQTLASIQVLA